VIIAAPDPLRADSEFLCAVVRRGGEQIQPSVPLNNLEHAALPKMPMH
jgi:hypothetical protein